MYGREIGSWFVSSLEMSNKKRAAPYYDDPEATTKFLQEVNEDDSDEEWNLTSLARKSDQDVIQYTKREKCLTWITFFLLVILISLSIAIFYIISTPHIIGCYDPECIEASSQVLSYMDFKADPCTDFYQYACGGWLEAARIPDGKPKWGAFAKVYQDNQYKLRSILEEDGNSYKGVPSLSVKKAKSYYKSCMDEIKLDEVGVKPAIELINYIGGWSLIANNSEAKKWEESSWDMTDTLVKIHQLKVDPLFGMWVSADDKNSSANIIQFTQAGIGLKAPEYYTSNDTTLREAYVHFGARVAELITYNGNKLEANAHHDLHDKTHNAMREVVKFETELAKIFVDKNDLRNPEKIYHKMQFAQLQDMAPNLKLKTFMKNIFGTIVPTDENIIVYTPTYFSKLNDLVKATSKKPMKLGKGRTTATCNNATCNGSYGIPVRLTEEMVTGIKEAFSENLEDVDWMDDKTKRVAKDKANAIIDKIAYPDWIERPADLDEYYNKSVIHEKDFFGNILNVRRFFTYKMLIRRRQPVDKSEWEMKPSEVNAYYSASTNNIVFPIGIFQRPFFGANYPMSINYGGIGMVIGHELTHGFDNEGHEFDKYGNLFNWWANSSLEAFQKRSQCFIKQYSQFNVDGNYFDGIYTLGENIADNGGLLLAYKAYKAWQNNNHETKTLVGLNLTSDQQFFVGFSQIWCTYYTPKYLKQAILTDPHTVAKYRVIGSLSNSKEFSEAFKCSSDKAMNPEDKCKLW
ncbi:endothelin-converting enzyme 1-like [Anneissia japonica]|uniref:endothelin-converting enzyme 1-like n=1 Tax=Anneissia japonica TaxID=1529436 RepID=UPI001425A407|nr:endothelin-converting enzyme 1-like [Anneissia japonica]